jgi:hypothetical protein
MQQVKGCKIRKATFHNWSNDDIFCEARILKVSRGKLEDVDLREARREGFDSVQAFRDFFGKKWNPKLRV